MIDYYANAVTLDEFRKYLAAATFTNPKLLSARQQVIFDLGAASDYALLGTLVDHLILHACSDGSELSLLGRAADLWEKGLSLYNQLSTIRNDFEEALASPSDPISVTRFNNAASEVQFFAQKAYAMQAEVTQLRADVTPMTYLSEHPRQLDKTSDRWDWGNLLIARRTDAFVRSMTKLSNDSPTRAFAFGALTNYGANVAGSAYLGHVVGGPRRLHRFRDRVGRNTIGGWLLRHYAGTLRAEKISNKVRFGNARQIILPSRIENLLKDAVTATFDLKKTPPLPDFQLGYHRLIRHLNIVDSFAKPPIPQPPSGIWEEKIYGDPSNPPPSLRTQDIGATGDPGGGVSFGNNSPSDPQPNQSDNSSGSAACGIIALLLIIVDVIQAFVQCIVQWAKKDKCTFWENMLLKKLWEKDPPDPRDPSRPESVNADSEGLSALLSSDEVTQFVAAMFDIHTQIWEALDRAYHFLAFHGLIYPDDVLLTLPVYKQFTTIPNVKQWPHRSTAFPLNQYHLYPGSRIENPAASPSPYLVGASPDAFLSVATGRIIMPLWEQINRGGGETQNLDMDADRGFLSACWATQGSINDDPVGVSLLAYGDQ